MSIINTSGSLVATHRDKFNSNVGIDLHKVSLTIADRDSGGNLVKTADIECKCVNKIKDFITSLPRPIHCAIESVGMYEWLWELLEPLCDKLTLADAVELKYRAGRRQAKTDKINARFFSLLVYKDDLPVSFVPDKTTRQFRKICRHWHATSEFLADIKIRMRWILIQHNLAGPGSITGESGRHWFLGFGHLLDSASSFTFSQLLDTVEHIELQRMPIRREILRFSQMPQYKPDIDLCCTVPGIADILSAIIVAEVAGFHRFSGPDAIACYTGLTERTEESGGKRSQGKISCAGPAALRWALCEAATTMVRSDPVYLAMYNHILKNTKIKGKAKVAMARKLIGWLWKMAKTREPFRRGGSTQHNRNVNIARQKARSLANLAAA
ncbi:MAG: IS110 family transposase [Candidatus Omnitrophota bacterium]